MSPRCIGGKNSWSQANQATWLVALFPFCIPSLSFSQIDSPAVQTAACPLSTQGVGQTLTATMATSAVLWIDEFGGTLLYSQPRLSVGGLHQPTRSDLALLAPLRPIHVWIERECEGYIWQAEGRCRYQNQEAAQGIWWPDTTLTLLADSGREACQLHLAIPDRRLLTARLTWSPPARPVLHWHAAILVSQALRIGATPTSHVCVPGLPELWLYPREDGWLLRCSVGVEYSGRCHLGELDLPAYWQIRVQGRHLALEPAPCHGV